MKILCLLIFLLGCASSDIVYRGVEQKHFNLAWNKNNDPAYDTGNSPIALNSPLIYKNRLFVGHNSGKMMAYQLDTGRLLWSHNDRSDYHSVPAIHNDNLIYGTVQGRVHARSLDTGKLSYSVDLGSSVESQGVIYKGRILFHLRSHRIICLDAETGKILWAYKRSVPSTTTLQRVSTPIIVKGIIYVGFADGYVLAVRLEDGVVLWEQKIAHGTKFVDVDMTPFYHAGKLLVRSMTDKLHILDAKTGNMIRQIPVTASRAPLQLGSTFVVGTADGEMVVLDRQFREIRRVKVSRFSISSICLWRGKVVATTVGHQMLLLDSKNLEVIDFFDFGNSSSAVFGAIQAEKEYLAVLSSRNRLYVFKYLRDSLSR